MKKVLVVVRCGDNSLHLEWVNEHSQFDVVLSYFGNDVKYDLTHIKYVHHFKGSKWQGLYDFFLNHQDLWQQYDYIWLPDDDLSTDVENLNQFFQLCQEYNFDLAQPALTVNSYYSHLMLLQIKQAIYRETNFVEVMMPCFSKKAFDLCWRTFAENKSGWGLEYLWYDILKNQYKIGIVDSTPIYHTRPIGSAGHGMSSNDEDNPYVEQANILKKYELKAYIGCLSIFTIDRKYFTGKKEILQQCKKGVHSVRLESRKRKRHFTEEIMHPFKDVYSKKVPFWKRLLNLK